MNYTIDANINFYDELMKSDAEENSDENNCLITDKILTDNYITLQCNHSFNYHAIYKEAINQKTKYNPNEITKLKMNELKCPYCRQVTPNILPYVPSVGSVCKIIGVTIPVKYSLPHKSVHGRLKVVRIKDLYVARTDLLANMEITVINIGIA